MNVQMRIITADNIDQLTSLNNKDNIVKLTGLGSLEEIAIKNKSKLYQSNSEYDAIKKTRTKYADKKMPWAIPDEEDGVEMSPPHNAAFDNAPLQLTPDTPPPSPEKDLLYWQLPNDPIPFTQEENDVLTELIDEFPDLDVSGKNEELSKERYINIRHAFIKRFLGSTRSITELRDQINLMELIKEFPDRDVMELRNQVKLMHKPPTPDYLDKQPSPDFIERMPTVLDDIEQDAENKQSPVYPLSTPPIVTPPLVEGIHPFPPPLSPTRPVDSGPHSPPTSPKMYFSEENPTSPTQDKALEQTKEKDTPERINIEKDFNTGLDLLSMPEQTEENSEDEENKENKDDKSVILT
jgi:hypothetical protein